MKLRNVLAPLLLGLLLANCSIDVSIEDITGNDFAKSSVLATSRGVGDGQTSASIVIVLKNSDGSLVTNYQPAFDFIDNNGSSYQGNGITFSQCGTSDDQGIVTCTVRSITVGVRRLLFNNIIIDLVGEIYFDPPDRDGTFFQVVSSGQVNKNAGGYSVTSHVGTAFSGLKQESNGYTIFSSTTGGITPVD